MNDLLSEVSWVGGNEGCEGAGIMPVSIRRMLNRLSNQRHLPVQQLMVRNEASAPGAPCLLYLTIFGGDPEHGQAYQDLVAAYEQIEPCTSHSIAAIRIVPVGLQPANRAMRITL
jgi:hypothetical protein